MDLKTFARDLADEARTSAELENSEYDIEMAKTILEYMVDCGEVNAPEICSFKKTHTRITAYDLNVEAESLDLFYFIQADTLAGKVNKNKIEQGCNFLSSFFREASDGTIFTDKEVKPSDEIVEVAKIIQNNFDSINQLRLYIITDGITDPNSVPSAIELDDGCIQEFYVWDIQRVYQQHRIRSGKEKVEIDFPTSYNTQLQCLQMFEENPEVDAYLAIIPGAVLAKIYKTYQQVLLEKNVRTFLQFKGKVNKQIRKTLKEQPEMFFSYNNGISTTASEIETKVEDGALYITRLFDWQIVNGGQTTASIAALSSDKTTDLTRVFVPMKISVIKNKVRSDEIVKAISTSANSQTAIKNSDFSANEPYLVELEKFSRETWVPNGNKKPVCKWYFERTRGQYLDQLAQLSGFNEKTFKTEYPKKQKITKTDIAKVENLWQMRPYDVCRGSEKNYELFVADVKKTKPAISELYYRRVIAKVILFNVVDSMVKAKQLGGYKANMNAYIMSALSFLSNQQLNLDYIWDSQDAQQEVKNMISKLIPIVWNHIIASSSTGNQASNVGEWTKKVDCWGRLKQKLDNIDRFEDELIQPETNEDGSVLNATQQDRIKEAEMIPANQWFAIAQWAKQYDELTPMDRKAAFNFGTLKSRGKSLTLKQAVYALQILKRASENNFDYENFVRANY